jgi:nucleoid DNA-binding protein
MNKEELAARLAKQAGVSRATAADQLDQVIHDILARLRRGEAAPLPGLGRFVPGEGFRFEPRKAKGRRKT